MTRSIPGAFGALLTAALLVPAALGAQSKPSEPATISQTIDGTKITIEYSRPRARTRDGLFGKVVHWNETWTPGANNATTLEISKDVKLNGRPLPKGKYSVWMVVKQTGPWVVALDTNHRRWHLPHPDTTPMLLRFPVAPEEAPFVDVLTWSFPSLRVNGGTITMQWGNIRIPIDVEVESSLRVRLAADEAERYIGRYAVTFTDDPSRTRTLVLAYEDSTLKGQWEPNDETMGRFAMIRLGSGWFAPGLYDQKGQIYEVLRPGMVFQFRLENGKAASFEVRNQSDKLEVTGKRQG